MHQAAGWAGRALALLGLVLGGAIPLQAQDAQGQFAERVYLSEMKSALQTIYLTQALYVVEFASLIPAESLSIYLGLDPEVDVPIYLEYVKGAERSLEAFTIRARHPETWRQCTLRAFAEAEPELRCDEVQRPAEIRSGGRTAFSWLERTRSEPWVPHPGRG